MPSLELTEEDFAEGAIDLISLLVKAELVKTRSEGRRAIEQGGVSLNGEKITDLKHQLTIEDIGKEGVLLKRGKKNFKKICLL